MFLDGFGESVIAAHVIRVVLRCRVVLLMALRALEMLFQSVLVGVQRVDNRAHTRHLAFPTPHWLRPQVFADEVHGVHLVHVQHVVEQLDRVVKLLLANAANGCSHNVLRRVDHTSVGLALRHNRVRNGTCGFTTGKLVLDQAKELNNPRVFFEGFLVHRIMRLGHPGDEKLDAFHAVVPPGRPLGEEDHDVHWVAFGRLLALGHRARELAVFVKEDRLELGVRHPLGLGPYRLTLPFRSADCNGFETEAWGIEMVPRYQTEEHLKMFGDVVFDKEALCIRNPVLPQLHNVVGTLVGRAHLHILHVPAHLCLHLCPEMLKEHMAAEVGLEAGFGTGLRNRELLLARRAN